LVTYSCFDLPFDSQDTEGERFAYQCMDAFNPNNKDILVAAYSVQHDSKTLVERDGVIV